VDIALSIVNEVNVKVFGNFVKTNFRPIKLPIFGPYGSQFLLLKLRCKERFTHAITACSCVFKELTLVGSDQGNYFENATSCSKRTLKTTSLKNYFSVNFSN
jgi:hypothetical protein